MNCGSRLSALVLTTVSACALAGCPPKTSTRHEPVATGATMPDANWPYWPVRMQIHPLTRITVDRKTGALVLEARVEFLDADGVSCRAFGQVLLELTDRDAGDESDALSNVWTVDLRDESANATHFDAVTRTYLFRLELTPDELPRQPELRIMYQGADGATMSHRQDVRPYVMESEQPVDAVGASDSPPGNVPVDIDDLFQADDHADVP
jgi:hypothetical protein